MALPIIPAIIMFILTVLIASLLFVPPTKYPLKNKIANFYWAGFWTFLAAIWSIAAAISTMTILGLNNFDFSNALLFSVVLSFMVFVAFAWFRLSATALIAGVKKLRT